MRPLQKLLSIASLATLSLGSAFGQVTVHVDPHATGKPIPENFLGLSFETSATLPDAKGHYPYFDPANQPLIPLFNTIGVKSLRIGGNTSDRPSVPVPTTVDIDQVFAFAQRANVRMIYTLRLRDSTPPQVPLTASHIMEHYPALVDCLVVGNEPNVYEHTYPKYAEDLKAFYPAVLSVAPHAKFCGPSTTPGSGTWVNSYIKDFHQMPQLYQVVQHSYPGGNSRKLTDPAAARANMLSANFEHDYQHLYDAFVPTALSSGVQYRIEETNSYYNGGAKDVSNTFASSLWALSYMYWWLAHDAQGINFHTGDQVAAGEAQTLLVRHLLERTARPRDPSHRLRTRRLPHRRTRQADSNRPLLQIGFARSLRNHSGRRHHLPHPHQQELRSYRQTGNPQDLSSAGLHQRGNHGTHSPKR